MSSVNPSPVKAASEDSGFWGRTPWGTCWIILLMLKSWNGLRPVKIYGKNQPVSRTTSPTDNLYHIDEAHLINYAAQSINVACGSEHKQKSALIRLEDLRQKKDFGGKPGVYAWGQLWTNRLY